MVSISTGEPYPAEAGITPIGGRVTCLAGSYRSAMLLGVGNDGEGAG